MTKLILAALALATAPLWIAAAPHPAAPQAAVAAPVTAASPTPIDPPAKTETALAEIDLQALLAASSNFVCIDSGISCSRNSDCVSVCGSLSCVCNRTCLYCP